MKRIYCKDYLIHLYRELVTEYCFDWRGGKLEDSENCNIIWTLSCIEDCEEYLRKRRQDYCKRKKKKVR